MLRDWMRLCDRGRSRHASKVSVLSYSMSRILGAEPMASWGKGGFGRNAQNACDI